VKYIRRLFARKYTYADRKVYKLKDRGIYLLVVESVSFTSVQGGLCL